MPPCATTNRPVRSGGGAASAVGPEEFDSGDAVQVGGRVGTTREMVGVEVALSVATAEESVAAVASACATIAANVGSGGGPPFPVNNTTIKRISRTTAAPPIRTTRR